MKRVNRQKRQLIHASISTFILVVYLAGMFATDILHPLYHSHHPVSCHEDHHHLHSHIGINESDHCEKTENLVHNKEVSGDSCLTDHCYLCLLGVIHQIAAEPTTYDPTINCFETSYREYTSNRYSYHFQAHTPPRAPPAPIA